MGAFGLPSFGQEIQEHGEDGGIGEVHKHASHNGHLVEVGEDMGMVVRRFLRSGMTMEEVSDRMDVSMGDLEKLLERDTGGHS